MNDDDNFSNCSRETFETTINNNNSHKYKKWTEKRDVHLHKTYRKNIETHEKEKIYYYNSGFTPGNRIRHAITGKYYNVLLGSLKEHFFFKVQFCLGVEPHSLFFNSPVEYSKFFNVSLCDNVIVAWQKKYLYYSQLLKINNDLPEKPQPKVIIVK
jgi:hypothetical protein